MQIKVRHSLRSFDLNLLPILRELLRQNNVTHAAETLGMSQSAVSEALKRLRHHFGDELLVKVGRSMIKTNYAKSIFADISELLTDIELVIEPSEFNPRNLDRRFLVAASDQIVLEIGPRLTRRLAEEAPRVIVHFVDLQRFDENSLLNGALDLAILPEGFYSEAGLVSRLFYTENYVKIRSSTRDDELLCKDPDDCSGMSGSHLLIGCCTELASTIDAPRKPASEREVLVCPQFISLPLLVAKTDAEAIIPQRIANLFAQLVDIEICPGSDDLNPTVFRSYWSDFLNHDAAHTWFRDLIHSAFNPGSEGLSQ